MLRKSPSKQWILLSVLIFNISVGELINNSILAGAQHRNSNKKKNNRNVTFQVYRLKIVEEGHYMKRFEKCKRS